jgi:hypothetical protein
VVKNFIIMFWQKLLYLIICLSLFSFFAFLVIALLSYSIFKLEKSKIDRIIKDNTKIKPDETKFSFARNAKFKTTNSEKDPNKFNFTTTTKNIFDGITAVGSGITSGISSKSIVLLGDEKSEGIKTSGKIISMINTNFFLLVKNCTKYLVKLRIEIDNFVKQRHGDEDLKNEIVLSANIKKREEVLKIKDITETIKKSNLDNDSFGVKSGFGIKSILPPDKKTKAKTATLDIAASKTATDDLFTKIEDSILQRLKKNNLTDYDIWLELGIHYEKFHEFSQAKEVYALVMKHAKDKEKDFAKNKLIALS